MVKPVASDSKSDAKNCRNVLTMHIYFRWMRIGLFFHFPNPYATALGNCLVENIKLLNLAIMQKCFSSTFQVCPFWI